MKAREILKKDFWQDKLGEIFDRLAASVRPQPELAPVPVRNQKPVLQRRNDYRPF